MRKKDRIHVTPQSQQENRSLNALRKYLEPWRCTFVDQRDDFGRDGKVQVIDSDSEGAYLSPLTFWVQSKSIAKTFSEEDGDSIESRHLIIWSDQYASSMILVLWSAKEEKFRFRSIQSIITEIDKTTPKWRDQKTVTVKFRIHDEFSDTELAKNFIKRVIKQSLDFYGGVEKHNSSVRKVVLSSLFQKGKFSTSQTLSVVSEDGNKADIVTGEGWIENDVDYFESFYQNILISALFLYEEIWIPYRGIELISNHIDYSLLIEMLERGRLKFYAIPGAPCFMYSKSEILGVVSTFKLIN
jgi:Domain of unknown function (DUF4365)